MSVAVPAFTRSAAAQEQGCVLTCPYYPSANTDPGTCSATVFWDPPTGNSLCGEEPEILCDHDSGEVFPGGSITTVTCTLFADPSITCTFDVYAYDGEDPTLTCAADISEIVDGPTAVSFDDPTVTDNCDPANYLVTCDHTSGETFPIGTTTVTCSVDYRPSGKGPIAFCSFDITLAVATATNTPEATDTPTEVPTGQPTAVDPTATIPSTESPATTVPEPTATSPVTTLPSTGSGGPTNRSAKLLPIAIVGGGAALLTRLGLRAKSRPEV